MELSHFIHRSSCISAENQLERNGGWPARIRLVTEGAEMLAVSHGLETKMRRASAEIAAVRDAILDIAMSLKDISGDPASDLIITRWHRLIDSVADIVIEAEDVA